MRLLGQKFQVFLLFFFMKMFYTQKKLKSKQATFTHKKHKTQTSNLHSDISMRLKRGKR